MASKKKLKRKLYRADLHIDRLVDIVEDLTKSAEARLGWYETNRQELWHHNQKLLAQQKKK